MVDGGPIGQDHIDKNALVLVIAVRLDRDFFPKGEVSDGVLDVVAVGLALVGIRTITGMLFVERCPV